MAPFGYAFSMINTNTSGTEIDIGVTVALGFDFWVGYTDANWDQTTTNWLRHGLHADYDDLDIAAFVDTAVGPLQTNVNLVGALNPSAVLFTNVSTPFTLQGSGHITGTMA